MSKGKQHEFQFSKTVAYCCIPMFWSWEIRDAKGYTNTLRTPSCLLKRKKTSLSAEDKAHNKSLANHEYALSILIVIVRFSELLKMFIAVNIKITR